MEQGITRLKIGNDHADLLAKQGRDVALQAMPRLLEAAILVSERRALAWMRWVGEIAHVLSTLKVRDTDAEKQRGAAPFTPQRGIRPRPVELGGHDLELQDDGRWRCGVCRRVCTSNSFASEWCAMPFAARLSAVKAPPMQELPHRMWKTGDVFWCARCGCYAEFRIQHRGLGGWCRGGTTQVTLMKRLRSGCHPVTKK